MSDLPPKAEEITPIEHGTYTIKELGGEEEELRLRQQVEAVIEIEAPFIEALNLDPSLMVLDLGCGPGFFSPSLGQKTGRLFGVDIDRESLGKAQACYRRNGFKGGVLRGSGYQLPFRDGTFDRVILRFVLQHLSMPRELLQETLRVLKPGGILWCVDTDDGGFALHPAPEGLDKLLRRAAEGQARGGGNRMIGRQMYNLALQAGFPDPEILVIPVMTTQLRMRTFFDITLGFKKKIIAEKDMSAEEVTRVVAECYALEKKPGAFGVTLAYGLRARKGT